MTEMLEIEAVDTYAQTVRGSVTRPRDPEYDEVRAYVAPRRGTEAVRAARSALLPLRATLAEPDYAAAFRHFAVRQRRRALVVFFTDVIDERASRALLAHVARNAARHLVVVVALRNDEVFSASTPAGIPRACRFAGAGTVLMNPPQASAVRVFSRSGIRGRFPRGCSAADRPGGRGTRIPCLLRSWG